MRTTVSKLNKTHDRICALEKRRQRVYGLRYQNITNHRPRRPQEVVSAQLRSIEKELRELWATKRRLLSELNGLGIDFFIDPCLPLSEGSFPVSSTQNGRKAA